MEVMTALVMMFCIVGVYADIPTVYCEGYCNVKRVNGAPNYNLPETGVCLYNANPLTKYGRSCFCKDGWGGNSCLDKHPVTKNQPHINENCIFSSADRTNVTDKIRLCGCSIGWGGSHCNETCPASLNCTSPNYCYYSEDQFRCACGPNMVGSKCDYDMTLLLEIHDLTAGYGFLTIYSLLLLFSLLVFGSNLRLKGCNMELFTLTILIFSITIKVATSIYTIIGVHWRKLGPKFSYFQAVFDYGPTYSNTFGSVLMLCVYVSIIFLCKHLANNVENPRGRSSGWLDFSLMFIINFMLLVVWFVVVLLSYFGVILTSALNLVLSLEILPLFAGFTLFAIKIRVELNKSLVGGAPIVYRLFKFLICNDIALLLLFTLTMAGTITLYLLPAFMHYVNMNIIVITQTYLNTAVNVIEVLIFLLMLYLLFNKTAFKVFICCCCYNPDDLEDLKSIDLISERNIDILDEDEEDINDTRTTKSLSRRSLLSEGYVNK
ncbi:teneurin [Acrasis kona]|uniref:Teneurin n=1 Tax=Acrasis kona TaxID=1008807 RepID=A0AAW2YWS5_9EUKA